MNRYASYKRETRDGCPSQSSGVAFGIVVIGVGIAWLLHRLGLITLPGISVLWPSIVIAVGFIKLFHRPPARAGIVFGLILMGIGAVLQLGTLGYLTIDIHTLWPFLVILAGVLIIWTSAHHHRGRHRAVETENQLSKFIVFGGEETRVTTKAFDGGAVTCIFAGIVLDLRDADIAGESAVLTISTIFAGVEIRVPAHFEVSIQGTPILGGFEDKSRVPDHIDIQNRKRLIIQASTVAGGIEVKN